MKMKEKQFCCFGSFKDWTGFIGLSRFVMSLISIFALVGLLFGAHQLLPAQFIEAVFGMNSTNATGDGWMAEEIYRGHVPLGTLSVLVFLGVYFVADLVLALVLLKGVDDKNPKYLEAWNSTTVLLLALLAIGVEVQYFCSKGSSTRGLILTCGIFLSLLVQGFCVWVVGTHKKELEARAESSIIASPVKAQAKGLFTPEG